MHGVVVALIVVLAVGVFVSTSAWWMNRALAPKLDSHAAEVARRRAHGDLPRPLATDPIRYTVRERRLLLAALIVEYPALLGGGLLLTRDGVLHVIGVALLLVGIAALLMRSLGRFLMARRAVRRTRAGRTPRDSTP